MNRRFIRTHLVCGRGVENLWISPHQALHKATSNVLALDREKHNATVHIICLVQCSTKSDFPQMLWITFVNMPPPRSIEEWGI